MPMRLLRIRNMLDADGIGLRLYGILDQIDVAAEVFIPFFTIKPHGSGIGLSLSRQILLMQRLSLSLMERPVNGYNVTFVIEKLA